MMQKSKFEGNMVAERHIAGANPLIVEAQNLASSMQLEVSQSPDSDEQIFILMRVLSAALSQDDVRKKYTKTSD